MPKHEPLTAKAIGIKIKSKGLQKLRWFCQMCQKQCRDQNGFKCHLTSESHQRQLLLFAESPGQYMNEFSTTFEKAYLDILRRQFGTKRVHCNMVYHEYIKDRNHVHMNSTCWFTLTGFVKYLGRTGIAKIDNTEKGWYIQYIDREEEERKEKYAKKQKMDKDDEERIMELVMKQAERAKEHVGESSDTSSKEPEYTDLLKMDEEKKIEFQIPKLNPIEKPMAASVSKANIFEKESDIKFKLKSSDKPSSSKKLAIEELKESEEKMKELRNRKDYWLHEGIVVKIVTKKLGDKYYKQKGVVKRVQDNYTGHVLVFDTNDILKLDQAHLETVIPAIGKHVMVVNGAYRGLKAVLEKLDESNFCVRIRIDEGTTKGRVLDGIQYEDVCKIHED